MANEKAARSGRAKKSVAKRSAKKAKKPSRKLAASKGAKPAKRAPAKKRAKRAPARKRAAAGPKLLTLTEVSKQTGISMPTLQRYKKEHQKQLQTVGEGRTQRYKPESLETFKKIKQENLKKRGRPRKAAAAKAAKARKPAKPAASAAEGLISLSEVGRRTGISYPTLLRYVKLHGGRIPSHGAGRKRRFPPRAVAVFSQLRKESRRGRRKGSPAAKAAAAGRGMEARVKKIEQGQARLEQQMKKLLKALQRPFIARI